MRDRASGTGLDLRLENVDIPIDRFGIRMFFGIGGYAYLEIPDGLNAGHQIGRRLVAIGMRTIGFADLRHITAKRNDVAHARSPIIPDNLVDLLATCPHAGQMRGGSEVRFFDDAFDGCMSSPACRSARAVGHRNERRLQWRKTLDSAP